MNTNTRSMTVAPKRGWHRGATVMERVHTCAFVAEKKSAPAAEAGERLLF